MGRSSQMSRPVKPNYGSLAIAILFLMMIAGLFGIILFPDQVGISPNKSNLLVMLIVICVIFFWITYYHYYQSTKPNDTTDNDEDGDDLI